MSLGRRVAKCVLLIAAVSAPAAHAESASSVPLAAKKTVLVLNTERAEFPPVIVFEASLRNGLADRLGEIEFHFEDLDFARFSSAEDKQEIARHLQNRYRGRKIDVVVTLLESATEFALLQRDRLFPNVPIVAAAVDRRWFAGLTLPSAVVGVPLFFDYRGPIELALALQPGLRQVVLVHGIGDFDLRRRDEAIEELGSFAPQLTYRSLGGSSMTDMEEQIRHLSPDSMVLMVSMVRSPDAVAYVGKDVVARLAPISPVPIYGMDESHMNAGAIGGVASDWSGAGRRTAAVVAKLLDGDTPTSMEVPGATRPRLRVNWQALHRWNIPVERAPRDAQFMFRPPSLWDEHKGAIIGIALALLLQGVLITLLLMELSRRRKAERILRESEMRFRSMADNTPVMIWMSGDDKLCTFFNKGWLDFTGRTFDQESGNGWMQDVHEEDSGHCLATYGAAFDSRRDFEMEYRLRRHDGEYRWVRNHGVPRYAPDGSFLGYIGSCIDVTDRRRMEEKFRLAAAALPAAIIMINEQGKIVLANAQTEKLFGYDHDELIGKSMEVLTPERLRGVYPMDWREFHRSREARTIGVGHDLYARRKDGSEFLAEIALNSVDSEEGTMVLAAIIDVTDRKELQRSRQELAHISRVSAMGELAGSLAHELNQPLTAIMSNAQAGQRFIASGKPADIEEVREILADIVQTDKRAAEVIRRMRSMVKKDNREVVQFDLVSAVQEVVLLLHSDAVIRNVRVTIEAQPDLPEMLGDRIQLQQVIMNLIVNAFDAMKELSTEAPTVSVHVDRTEDNMLRVAVSDIGHGIPQEASERIFEAFYTTKKTGLGMGLSISRSIVEAHGGRLWVKNNPERGATFFFTIPRAAA